MALAFIPQPKKITVGTGRFALPRAGTIGIPSQEYLPAADDARDASQPS